MIPKFNYIVAEVSEKMFNEFATACKYAVVANVYGEEMIIGFANEADANGLEDELRFCDFADVKTLSHHRDIWLLGVRDAELPPLVERFKYTIIGWNDTEDDEGEDIIGFTDSLNVHHSVIWDYDYFEAIDNVSGSHYVPSVY